MSRFVIARSTLVRRSPPSGEGGCDEAIHSFFAARWIASLTLAMTLRECSACLSYPLGGQALQREGETSPTPNCHRRVIAAFPIIFESAYGGAAALPSANSNYIDTSKAWRQP